MGDRGALVKRRVDGIVTKIINGASPYCNSVIAQLRAPEFSFLYLAFWLRRIYFVLPANEKQRDYALAYGKKRKSLGFRLEAAKDIIGPADPFEHIDLRHPPPPPRTPPHRLIYRLSMSLLTGPYHSQWSM
jgi:hypothetical protein